MAVNAAPEETPVLMSDLVHWYNEEEQRGEMHPVDLAIGWQRSHSPTVGQLHLDPSWLPYGGGTLKEEEGISGGFASG